MWDNSLNSLTGQLSARGEESLPSATHNTSQSQSAVVFKKSSPALELSSGFCLGGCVEFLEFWVNEVQIARINMSNRPSMLINRELDLTRPHSRVL